jgi:hypothetical protein
MNRGTSHPSYAERYNGFVAVFILMVIATALFIAGTSTAFSVHEIGNLYVTNTFFESTITNGATESSARTVSACGEFQALIEAGRAFTIATTVLGGLIMLGAFVRLLHNDLLLGLGRVPFVIGFVFLLLIGCVAWILAFVAYAETFCGSALSDDPDNRVGPSGPLFVTGWVIAIIAMVLEIVYDGSSESPAPHTVSTAGSSHVMVPAATHGSSAGGMHAAAA